MITRKRLKLSKHWALRGGLLLMLILGGGWVVSRSPSFTIRGVPLPILVKFFRDEPARSAFFRGDTQALHDRLNGLGVEAEMKAFYRAQFRDEGQLDQHVHQIFFDVTGYVGKAYRLNDQGRLVWKNSPTQQFDQWFRLALQAGVVVDRHQVNGVQYVISPQGVEAPYHQIAGIYPKSLLRQLIKTKQAQ